MKRYKLSPPEFDLSQLVDSSGKPTGVEKVMDGLSTVWA